MMFIRSKKKNSILGLLSTQNPQAFYLLTTMHKVLFTLAQERILALRIILELSLYMTYCIYSSSSNLLILYFGFSCSESILKNLRELYFRFYPKRVLLGVPPIMNSPLSGRNSIQVGLLFIVRGRIIITAIQN